MSKIIQYALIGLVSVVLSFCSSPKTGKDKLYTDFDSDIDSLVLMNDEFLKLVKEKKQAGELKIPFLKLRLQFKKVEAFAEYFAPSTVRLVNGAPLDEIEDEENAVFEPGGLQVIEELIYTREAVEQEELIRHVRKMQVNVKRIKTLWKDIRITDSHVFDALRLELFRLITLGISGFDTPASGNVIAESVAVLESFDRYLLAYQDILPEYENLKDLTERAIGYLKANPDLNTFNRAVFIADYINPISVSLKTNREAASIPALKDRRLLDSDAATLFENGAFNSENLLSNPKLGSTANRISLGQKLFYDGRVSGNGKTNCGTCHQPALAYSDGITTSKGVTAGNIKRNAPTIMYSALQQALFYDLRSPSLEDQAADVIHNKEEMSGSLKNIARLTGTDSDYKKLFKKAYPKLDSVQPMHIQSALAVFVRSLSPFNSPFDQYMRGDKKALTDNQVKGFNLFMGKARCGTCHFMPLFNGTVPPDYQRSESEVLGITKSADLKNPVLDNDPGRGVHNQFPQWKNSFKTQTVRNIAKTAPYMHNGAFQTLEQVMDFYNEGGGAGLGLNVPNQTLSGDKLNLTPLEIGLVIDFMKSLTDR
ncbi:cytochrome-c peroxidase [Dyadobacter psychrotolerans]|nr:cytochrome c peroxidase [Dyadobacter psychrotolerans]